MVDSLIHEFSGFKREDVGCSGPAAAHRCGRRLPISGLCGSPRWPSCGRLLRLHPHCTERWAAERPAQSGARGRPCRSGARNSGPLLVVAIMPCRLAGGASSRATRPSILLSPPVLRPRWPTRKSQSSRPRPRTRVRTATNDDRPEHPQLSISASVPSRAVGAPPRTGRRSRAARPH